MLIKGMRAANKTCTRQATVLATAFENNCPDILKVDCEMYYNLTGIQHF